MAQDNLDKHLEELSKKYNADVLLFTGPIDFTTADSLIHSVRKIENRKKNVVLILTTSGGHPDHAYRAISYLQRKYQSLIYLIFGICKSAGTLMALGADKIVMSDFSELGPLDIQLNKEEELIQSSGLDYIKSITSIGNRGFDIIDHVFTSLKRKSGGLITTKTATEVGASLANGLLSPITAQIDPVKLGEINRALMIAKEYGSRLCDNEQLINKLAVDYPSHSFVIDIKEAMEIFNCVEEAGPVELNIEKSLLELVRVPHREGLVLPLYPDLDKEKNKEKTYAEESKNGSKNKDEQKETGNKNKKKNKQKE